MYNNRRRKTRTREQKLRSVLEASARESVVAGASFALVETLLTYTTGAVHRGDAALVFAAGFLLWLAAGTGLGLVLAALQASSARAACLRALVLLGAPLLLFGLRGDFAPAALAARPWVSALRWIGTLLLFGVVAACAWRRRNAGISLGWFAAASLASQTLAALGLAARVVEPSQLATPRLAAVPLALGLLAAVVAGLRQRPARLAAAAPLVALGLAASVAWGFGGSWPRPGPIPGGGVRARGPSVLLITLDTVRADHLSCYGYRLPTTPTLDALASTATLFTRAYAPSPYTLSSHASLFTGLLPSRHGAHPVPYAKDALPTPGGSTLQDFALEDGVETLAMRLAGRGYRTAGIAANDAYLAPWTGLGRGFDYYDTNTSRLAYGYVPLALPLALRLAPALYERLTYGPEWRADKITDAALRFLSRTGPAPFLLFLNYLDAHAPYDPRPPFNARFLARPGMKPASVAAIEADVVGGRRPLGAEERDYLTAQYDGELGFVDEQLGRLFAWLRSARRFDDLIIVVTSDHGEFLGEHGLLEHDNELYEEALRVPLLVKLKKQTLAARLDSRIGLADVPALIERALGAAAAPGTLAEPAGSPEPAVLAEYWTPPRTRRLNPARFRARVLRAIGLGSYKLIERDDGDDALYDLAQDPQEQRNLLETDPVRAREIRARALAGLPPLASASSTRKPPEADAETRERLRALGYAH